MEAERNVLELLRPRRWNPQVVKTLWRHPVHSPARTKPHLFQQEVTVMRKNIKIQ